MTEIDPNKIITTAIVTIIGLCAGWMADNLVKSEEIQAQSREITFTQRQVTAIAEIYSEGCR